MTNNQVSYQKLTDSVNVQIKELDDGMEQEIYEDGDMNFFYDKHSGDVIGVEIENISEKGNVEIPEHIKDIRGEQ